MRRALEPKTSPGPTALTIASFVAFIFAQRRDVIRPARTCISSAEFRNQLSLRLDEVK